MDEGIKFLPNRLKSGDMIDTGSMIVRIHKTVKKDIEGEPLYRLRYDSGVLGNGRFTRDDLQEMGCKLMEVDDE